MNNNQQNAGVWIPYKEGDPLPEVENLLAQFDGDHCPYPSNRENIRTNQGLGYRLIAYAISTPYVPERRRVQKNCTYYFVSGGGEVVNTPELGWEDDDIQWTVGNYFETEDEARSSKFYKVFHE